MLLNNVKEDIKGICREEGVTQVAIAKELGVTKQAIGQAFTKQIVNRLFIEILELLGYDIEIRYLKRDAINR